MIENLPARDYIPHCSSCGAEYPDQCGHYRSCEFYEEPEKKSSVSDFPASAFVQPPMWDVDRIFADVHPPVSSPVFVSNCCGARRTQPSISGDNTGYCPKCGMACVFEPELPEIAASAVRIIDMTNNCRTMDAWKRPLGLGTHPNYDGLD